MQVLVGLQLLQPETGTVVEVQFLVPSSVGYEEEKWSFPYVCNKII